MRQGQVEVIADGDFHPVPGAVESIAERVPQTTDIYNNAWTLAASPEDGTRVMVLPANSPQRWQTVPLDVDDAGGEWKSIFADQVGFIWIGGPPGLRRFDPRQADAAWQHLGDTSVTALGPSPDGLALSGFESGELVEMDVDAAGTPLVNALPGLPGAVLCTYVDQDGGVWAATATDLFYYSPAPEAWQRNWRSIGNLPGGNHDIFSVVIDGKLYTAGGLTAGWGYPPTTHVFDELFAFEPEQSRWTAVSRMPFPRCYNGLAVFDGHIWVVGGSANLGDPDNPDGKRLPLDSVIFYDAMKDAWSEAPSLNAPRNEPTVLASAGRLYAIGGSGADGAMVTVESIGAGEDAWRFEAAAPVPINQAAGCVLNGIIYCISKDGFFAFDPITDHWDGDLPQLEQSPQAALVGAFENEIWVMGGSRLKASHRYDPTSRKWLPAPDLPTDQSWGAAHALGHRLIIAGGAHWSEVHQTYIYEDRTFALKKDYRKDSD